MTQQETIWGWFYLIVQIFVLPTLLEFANAVLPVKLTASELAFTRYLLNFLAALWIFHNYLGKNMDQVHHHPAYFFQAVILGFVAYWACGYAMEKVMGLLYPGFSNANDASIAALAKNGFYLTVVGTVILVPLAEECFYRGLIFRGLYGKSPWAAYIISIAVFAAVHVIGYIGSLSWLDLLICFLQYVPAGLCLAWAYAKSDTIFAPVLIHATINAVAALKLR